MALASGGKREIIKGESTKRAARERGLRAEISVPAIPPYPVCSFIWIFLEERGQTCPMLPQRARKTNAEGIFLF